MSRQITHLKHEYDLDFLDCNRRHSNLRGNVGIVYLMSRPILWAVMLSLTPFLAIFLLFMAGWIRFEKNVLGGKTAYDLK